MKKGVLVGLAFVLALAMPAVALAAGGNGSGGGNGGGGGKGGGSSEPLTVSAASIEEGASIAAGDSITLTFSKNVCDSAVREANAGLVSLATVEDVAVEADVVLADDQIEPEKKNDITVTPKAPLAPGSYVLTAKAGITSKSSDVLAQDYLLTFTVEGAAPAASDDAAAADTAAASDAADGTAANAGGGISIVTVIAIIAVAALIIAGVVLAMRKKRFE